MTMPQRFQSLPAGERRRLWRRSKREIADGSILFPPVLTGFTLLELVIVIAVITVGVLGAMVLLTNSLASTRAVRNEVIAANLAQEAIEIIHSIRDQNVATGGSANWSQGMDTGATYRVDTLVDPGIVPLDTNPNLNVSADGFYTYQTGTETPFKRTVQFEMFEDASRDRKVIVTITWPGRVLAMTSVITAWR